MWKNKHVKGVIMKELIEKVRKFCKVCEYPTRETPGFPNGDVQNQCTDLLKEEVEEFCQSFKIEDVADALGDILYSVIFAALCYGIPLPEVFDEIHKSNMTKLWPDGKPRKRKFNRLEKGPNYKPPELLKILREHM